LTSKFRLRIDRSSFSLAWDFNALWIFGDSRIEDNSISGSEMNLAENILLGVGAASSVVASFSATIHAFRAGKPG
jgi:hypothetical protein